MIRITSRANISPFNRIFAFKYIHPLSTLYYLGYEKLLANNKRWVNDRLSEDPYFFERLSHIQIPKVLWIGCSDSRIPPTAVTGTRPGDIFEHRNVANLVIHTDMNIMTVLQYAVETLKVGVICLLIIK